MGTCFTAIGRRDEVVLAATDASGKLYRAEPQLQEALAVLCEAFCRPQMLLTLRDVLNASPGLLIVVSSAGVGFETSDGVSLMVKSTWDTTQVELKSSAQEGVTDAQLQTRMAQVRDRTPGISWVEAPAAQ